MVNMGTSLNLIRNSMGKSLVTILICLGFWSCHKPQKMISEPQVETDQFEILWKTPISPGPFVLGLNPILYDSLVIVNTEYEIYDDFAAVLFIDTATGTVVDTWSEYIDGTALYTSDKFYLEDDFLVLHTMRSTDVLNLNTRQRQWASTTNQDQSAFLYGNNGFVYTSHQIGAKTAKILRSPVDQKNWETVYSFTANGAMRPFFDGIGFGALDNGDEIVFWENRITHPYDKLEIFAYNLTADTLLWRNRDFPTADIPFPPRVYNGKVYGRYVESVYCIDLETGQMLWLKDYGTAFEQSGLAAKINYIGMYNDQLVVKPDCNTILFVDLEDGSIDKMVSGYEDGNPEGEFSYWQEKLYFNNGLQLAVTDLATGENLVTPENSRALEGITIYSSITVDPVYGKLYFQDGHYLYCVKQPEGLLH